MAKNLSSEEFTSEEYILTRNYSTVNRDHKYFFHKDVSRFRINFSLLRKYSCVRACLSFVEASSSALLFSSPGVC